MKKPPIYPDEDAPFQAAPPTHTIKVKHMASGKSGVAGVAWLNETGSISIQLRPGVVLSWNDGLAITAFPNKD